MKPTLEKLWNGSLAPADTCGEADPELEELTVLMDKNKAELESMLSEQQKAAFKKYLDCCEKYSCFLTAHAFASGFSLATKLLTEALQQDT